jgi:hypothetical protein
MTLETCASAACRLELWNLELANNPTFPNFKNQMCCFSKDSLCHRYCEREANVVQSAKGMQTWQFFLSLLLLLLLFVDVCFTKSVNCHVVRLFLVTYDNCDISCFCQLTTRLTHWGCEAGGPTTFFLLLFLFLSFTSIQFNSVLLLLLLLISVVDKRRPQQLTPLHD